MAVGIVVVLCLIAPESELSDQASRVNHTEIGYTRAAGIKSARISIQEREYTLGSDSLSYVANPFRFSKSKHQNTTRLPIKKQPNNQG